MAQRLALTQAVHDLCTSPFVLHKREELGRPEDLVDRLVGEGIRDPRLLAAYRRVPRSTFVPREWAHLSYLDVPVPIGHDQVTSQPSLIALMVDALRLDGRERVLEVGTGLGFQTAILAMMCREVYSIEWFAALAEQARRNLETAQIRNAFVVAGDGTLGLPEHAPYDGIITCAAAARVPDALVRQLVDGGRLVHPRGPSGNEEVLAYRKKGSSLVVDHRVVHASFVPMMHGARTR